MEPNYHMFTYATTICIILARSLYFQDIIEVYSLSRRTSYHRKISWSLEAARFGFIFFQSLWNILTFSLRIISAYISGINQF